MSGPEILRTEALGRRFGGLAAVSDVSLSIATGEVHAIIGPNGAGKTTLLNLLSGELTPTAGRIYFEGRDITRSSPDQRSRIGIGRSFQHSSVFEGFTTGENVRLAAQSRQPTSMQFLRDAWQLEAVNQRARAAIEAIDLRSVDALAGEISHGEQRQLEIAMILATAPRLMLLDEPTSGMGKSETQELIATLQKLRARHTIVLVEHDMDLVFTLADRITVLVYGKVIATGTPTQVRADEKVRAAYLGGKA